MVLSSLLNVVTDEGMTFIAFVQKSLYPKGNNASKDEGL
jgi:hypothetical protein